MRNVCDRAYRQLAALAETFRSPDSAEVHSSSVLAVKDRGRVALRGLAIFYGFLVFEDETASDYPKQPQLPGCWLPTPRRVTALTGRKAEKLAARSPEPSLRAEISKCCRPGYTELGYTEGRNKIKQGVFAFTRRNP